MIKNPLNKGNTSWTEAFDLERLTEIAQLAQKDRAPNGTFSDFECYVWQIMTKLRDGIEVK